MTNSLRHYIRRRNLIIKCFGGVCTSCGKNEMLEFHIANGGTGKSPGGWQHLIMVEKILLESKEPVNLLCLGCHLKEHMKNK